MTPVVLLRRGPSGALMAAALAQEGIAFEEGRPQDLDRLDASEGARVLIVPAPLDAPDLAALSRWQARGGATVLLGSGWPPGVLRDLVGVRDLPCSVDGGKLWAGAPDFMLPAIAPDRPLQITGERRLYTIEAPETLVLALGSAPPCAAVALDANRDGVIDDEYYFCGPSLSMLSRGRPGVIDFTVPGAGPLAVRAAAAGDLTGDGFADDLLVASGDVFAVRRAGVWAAPGRAPAPIRHALSLPGPGRLWTVQLFLGDGSEYVTSLDGARTFGAPSRFAPAGQPSASDFSYSFDFIDASGARRSGVHIWSGDVFHADLGSGLGPASIADLGPRYLSANIVRPGLGLCSDADRRRLRDVLTLLVGDNLYRLDPSTGTFEYPRALHREVDVRRWPLVVRKGRTIAFLFDLERTVKDLQQGRPDRVPPAGRRPRGLPPVIAAFDDWIDYTAWDLPQADLHERLLARAITSLLRLPLPRVWYWPDAARGVASMSHDVETSRPGEESAVRACTLEIARRAAEAGRSDTFFLMEDPKEERLLSVEDLAELGRLGHCVALHFNTFGAPDRPPATFADQAARLRALGAAPVAGNRTHGLAWLGDIVPAALRSEPEMTFDSSLGGGPGFSHCGSALPYHIHDQRGEPFTSFEEIPHALMDVADAEFYFSGALPPGLLAMTVAELMERARALALRNDESLHGVIDCSFHPVVVAGLVPPIPPFLDALTAHARFLSAAGIPSMSLEQIAAWWRLRRGVRIVDISQSGGRLDFAVEIARAAARATILLPAAHAGAALAEVLADGKPAAFCERVIDGAPAAMIVLAGSKGRVRLSATYRP